MFVGQKLVLRCKGVKIRPIASDVFLTYGFVVEVLWRNSMRLHILTLNSVFNTWARLHHSTVVVCVCVCVCVCV